MTANPYGASCGTSIVVAPSVAKVQSGKIGTRGARLSDTKSGKAPKRVRTREELESMDNHPAGKRLNPRMSALTHDDKCKCYCTKVKSVMAELAADLEELEEISRNIDARNHAEVMANIAEEANREKVKAEAVKAHLYLVGDNDA